MPQKVRELDPLLRLSTERKDDPCRNQDDRKARGDRQNQSNPNESTAQQHLTSRIRRQDGRAMLPRSPPSSIRHRDARDARPPSSWFRGPSLWPPPKSDGSSRAPAQHPRSASAPSNSPPDQREWR